MGFLFPTAEGEVAEVLSLMRRIVASGWDREWASDKDGNQVDEWSEEAVNFSLLAALSKAQDMLDGVVDNVVDLPCGILHHEHSSLQRHRA